MAQTMTAAAAGRVNRRFLFLALILAAISAALVYTALSRPEGGTESPAVGVSVVVAKDAIPAGTRITAELLEVRQLPAGAVGAQPLASIEAAVGKVTRYPIAASEQLLLSKVIDTSVAGNDVLRNIVAEGQRALAIRTEAVVGAGGLVLPGDHVDVFWVPEEVLADHEGAMLLAEDVEVLAVEQALVELAPTAPGLQEEGAESAGDQRVRSADGDPIPDAATVTLLLTPEQARLIFCAELSGSLRLAVRAFGDATTSGLPPAICVLLAPEEQ